MQGSVKGQRAHEYSTFSLTAIDRTLAAAPHDVQAASLALTRCVVRLRDALIEARRGTSAGAVCRELAHANALLSLVFSIQYPLEGMHREKLTQARDALAALVAETQQDK